MRTALYDLVSRLREEDRGGNYVYRGQTSEYAVPLVPSMFRPMVTDSRRFRCPAGVPALRGTSDAKFVETLRAEQVQARLPHARIVDYAQRLGVKDRLIELFGYPLAQILAQQAGLWSEGLDVTTSLDVALFFATHDYNRDEDCYQPIAAGSGVLYRWPVSPARLTVHDLAQMDFYTCPLHLPSGNILASFGDAKNDAAFVLDLIKFWMRRKGARLEPLGQPAVDPFSALTISRKALAESRIIRQAAALLIPAQILSKYWSRDAAHPRIPEDRAWDGPMCVEDLAQSRGVTKYQFDHNLVNKTLVTLDAATVFPKHDACCVLVRDCVNFCFWAARYGSSGTLTVIGNQVGTLRIIWDDFVYDNLAQDDVVVRLML